ncbi:Uncharacterized protein ESCO_005920 [Escovopsis weberi]|uniref:Amine oxidase domain-containing protein n=1 Tax=Escovopsis weberi TaxID=150374 RepID=A0A0M9VRT4_ESCWE|nr:Uncharacterized protein ESCO_005920 [Escovopsis weberi]
MHLSVSLLAAAAAAVAPVLGSPAVAPLGGGPAFQEYHDEVIERDVVILGGGSTGTYAAVHLQDRNHSVVVVERKEKLGGHTETEYYHKGMVDMGVTLHFNDTVTKNFYERLGVAYEKYVEPGRNMYVDFKTGKRLPQPMGMNLSTIVPMYNKAIANFSYTADGTFNFPEPIPEELLGTFGQFLDAHPELKPALNLVYMFAQGVGDLLNAPLLYVLQNVGLVHVDAILKGLIMPKAGMYEIFDHAARAIGQENILLGSEAVSVERGTGTDGVRVIVQDGAGRRTVIRAQKLLVTIPPLMSNMQTFDLDESEAALFSKWEWKNYYVSVIANSGLPNATSVVNFDPSEPSGLPVPPFHWAAQYLGTPGYVGSKVIAPMDFTEEEAREMMLADIRRMNGTNPEIVAWGNHSPMSMGVPVDDIRDGFYKKLYALQGQRNTFYSGLAWCSDYSSVLWAFTETILDQMYPKA